MRVFFPQSQAQSAVAGAERPSRYWQQGWTIVLTLVLVISSWLFSGVSPAWAGLEDDHFDGNIFALYAGNGSLVPPRVALADSLKHQKPALLVFYVEDSRDCKQFAGVVSQLQAYYGKAADFIPINADSLAPKSSYKPTDVGYYYAGVVPQTVVINQAGKVVLNAKGMVSFESIDDVMRQVFDLLPRSQSVELRRRIVNEINTELVPNQP